MLGKEKAEKERVKLPPIDDGAPTAALYEMPGEIEQLVQEHQGPGDEETEEPTAPRGT
ncbi:hypothetical protein OHO28_51010 [Streptomyces europaeiscabiei]|uniref:hypothetical protein n=1 Tax=Streptomyces europaeiscabiei TaxID=146819 RepID=UPI002E1738E0